MAPGPEHPTVKHFYEQRGHNSPRHIVGFVGASGDRRSTGKYSWPPPPDQGRHQFWRGSVGLKAVAVVAGLGHMGIHRNVIHPRFGNFILLGTVLVDAEVSEYSHPIVYNPCLECNAVRRCLSDGATGPASSISLPWYTHNHREFMGGFSDWVEQIADSGSAHEYREKSHPRRWFPCGKVCRFAANYKAAYCMAVCPEGEDVIAPFLTNRKVYLENVLKPFQNKPEADYGVSKSDAEEQHDILR